MPAGGETARRATAWPAYVAQEASMMTGRRQPGSLARLVRVNCPQCGSRLLHWFMGDEARHYLPADQLDELEEWMESARLRGIDAQAECWRCLRCSDFGIFTDI